MYCVFAAETAIFFHFQPVGIVFPVFHRIVIPLPAVVAGKSNPYAHGLAPFNILHGIWNINNARRRSINKAKKKNLLSRPNKYTTYKH